ncbi:MAG: DUF1501 domain-containing protein [Planctomycetota bacterium]
MNDNLNDMLARRTFLRRGACAALGLTGLTSQLMAMRSIGAALDGQQFNDYKALVCVFLFGGNDAGNTVIPYENGDQNYEFYAQQRTNLAIPKPELAGTVIAPQGLGGRTFALHPVMPFMASQFAAGNASILANVGTLLYPMTRTSYRDGSVERPSQLFSHSDQQDQWQLTKPDSVAGRGWGGRIADMLQANGANANSNVSMNLSLDGQNIFQTGNTIQPFSLGQNGPISPNRGGLGGTSEREVIEQALLDMYAVESDPMHPNKSAMRKAVADVSSRSMVLSEFISTELANTSLPPRPDPASTLLRELDVVARMIEIAPILGHQRQIFFIGLGGFDNHDGLFGTTVFDGPHAQQLGRLDQALQYFWNAMGLLNKRNEVTTFTASDFARTYRSNGNGSDHGWGAEHFIMGGTQMKNGGTMFGEYPSIEIDGNDDSGNRGRFVPTTSVEQYGYEFARWMGVPNSEMTTVFPNIQRFMDINDPSTHLGILQ